MAERVGFEPTLPFRVNTLSKRAPSATRPSLRRSLGKWISGSYLCRTGQWLLPLGLIILWGIAATAQIGRRKESGALLRSGISAVTLRTGGHHRERFRSVRSNVDHFLLNRSAVPVSVSSQGRSGRQARVHPRPSSCTEFSLARSPSTPTQSYRLLHESL